MIASLQAVVTHSHYVGFNDAHYAGNLVDGAFTLRLFGDAATHLMVLLDGHEGLFASYDSVEFLAPVRGGDVLEITAQVESMGRRSRAIRLHARVLCRSVGDDGASERLGEPILAVRALGTVVIPAPVT